MNSQKIKFIDLFAGIGGFHTAFHQINCECVFASEIDESARNTYIQNYYSISPKLFDDGFFNDDIRKISPSQIPDFDVLCAGFPCQPFSQAGYKKGFTDGRNSERGNLFFNIVDILDAKKPKAFFLENVRGIQNHDNGNTLKVIREILEDELGYSFYLKIIRATDYGLPQHRPRAFMIGFRDEGFLKGFEFPENLPLKFNMSDVFDGECSREIGFTLRVGGAGSNINDRRNWDSYLVNNKVIRIQPQHALKIQGFPSDFKLPSSRTEAMKQLGNSVAVDAIKACASELISHMNRLGKQKIKKDPMAKTLNKGERTELYTFLKILVNKKLEFCDEDLNPNGESFKVHKVSTLNIKEMVFLDNDIVTVENETGSKSDVSKVVKKRDLLEIKNGILNNVSTFEIKKAKKIFEELGINIIRGGASNQKADIVLDVSQNKKNFKNEGFGIKSYFGAKPTLLNASGSNTNFIFELINFDEKYLDEINGIDTRTKITDRLNKIYEKCSNLKFYKVEADVMNYNLKVLDDELPRLLASLLLNFYINRTNILSDNLREIFDNELINYNLSLDYKAYTIKVKRFLIAILLGMFSSKKWGGINTSNGIIVVKDDGSQVVFHITKLPILENFLFKNIKFDTPSSTRHRFGSIYKERNGKFYIKLNIQLRF